MHPDAKAILDRIETFRCRQLGACGLEIDHEGNHLGRDLVAAFGTPPARQQTGEPGHLIASNRKRPPLPSARSPAPSTELRSCPKSQRGLQR